MSTDTQKPDADEIEVWSARQLRPFLRQAGMCIDAHFPLYLETVEAIVDANDYSCDRQLILELVRDVIPVGRDESEQQQWSASNIWHLLMQLEGRRRWKPFSPLHEFKFNAAEKAQHAAEKHGASTFLEDLGRFDIEALLIFMQDADEPHVRQVLRLALLTKFSQSGAL